MAERDEEDEQEVQALPTDRQGRESAAALDKITGSVCVLQKAWGLKQHTSELPFPV